LVIGVVILSPKGGEGSSDCLKLLGYAPGSFFSSFREFFDFEESKDVFD
jgi:hypothetical protein